MLPTASLPNLSLASSSPAHNLSVNKILKKLARKMGFIPAKDAARNYGMAQIDRLTADWIGTISDANREIRYDIETMRERSRILERDDDYASHYLDLCENNVLGHCGVGLQMKITEMVKQGGKWVEQYDDLANGIIEDSFDKWSRREFCTVTGNYSWLDVQRLMLRSAVRDGSSISRDHIGGKFGYALEPLEADYLDIKFNGMSTRGNQIILGQEIDAQKRIIAYWLWTNHPATSKPA